ncbi:cytoskeletal protein RodZ [Sporomusa ovata DSM 2662]|uniref:Transcriptional regulator in cluster with unspecified monosaccharide ABC transport system n=1 Tax=Sporomusa ovata TaxID=2378 RepID=A0A0U1L588_9FIRM|nr:RodZ domain-containing protein [Sporomusa ovata]EQB26100.1 transcriptional regulator, XRE family [Sporomusa ovata DSM 2662]CQR74675.1 Transcriptional regulator in cluster with unspecified monosaccharide ABC transport system [Sporomusa ovata]
MQTVGEFLRAERLKKALSIKDVESAINIRALYLNAIEEGDYDIVPGEVYLKGFIRNYATFLGLDPHTAIDLYSQNKEQTNENIIAEKQQEVIPVASTPRRGSGGGLKKMLTVVAATAGVLIVAGLIWWPSESQQPAPVPPPVVTPQPAPAVQPGTPVTPAGKVIVTAKYSAPCWTQIIADGKEIYEGTPKIGESITWEAANKLSVKFGNAGVVDVVYNGSPVGKIGGNGEVVVKTFTLTGITK